MRKLVQSAHLCGKESCATNSAILSLGATTPEGQLKELVSEVKSNGYAAVLELPGGGSLIDTAREKVKDPSNNGLNEASRRVPVTRAGSTSCGLALAPPCPSARALLTLSGAAGRSVAGRRSSSEPA